jgi:hypothetical protein
LAFGAAGKMVSFLTEKQGIWKAELLVYFIGKQLKLQEI